MELQSPWITEDTMEYVCVCMCGGGRGAKEMKVEMTLFLGSRKTRSPGVGEASVGILGQEHPSPPVSTQAAQGVP